MPAGAQTSQDRMEPGGAILGGMETATQEQNLKWGEHPIADKALPAYCQRMRHKFSQNQTQKPAGTPPAAIKEPSPSEVNFTPSPDEVARRAYFSYENEGSLPGRDVQHWLKAEADLIAERKLTRVHGFHNRN
jgi:hypothetical protein